MRYPKHYRLRDNERFSLVKQDGEAWRSALLVLCVLPNDLAHSRFGIAVGKRISKAVGRNRLKRLIREAVRLHLVQIAPGWDLVLIARGAAYGATFHEVEAHVQSLLQRAGLWRDIPSQEI